MINSQTLKTFVKMHEYKLNAKINTLRAGRLHDRLEEASDLDLAEVDETELSFDDERSMQPSAHAKDGRSPKSQYFNFIGTATHR